MMGTIFGRDQKTLDEKLKGRAVAELREKGLVVGTASEFAEQLQRYEEAGVQQIMLQWIDLDDLDGLEKMAEAVL